MVPMLSALIITKNEEDVIGQCLDLLQWADECVVIDSGSTDATCEIARAHGARVIHNDWPGYGAQRNFGGEQCRGDWILAVDADEEITPGLSKAIQDTLSSDPEYEVFKIQRVEVLFGKQLRFGASLHYLPRLYRSHFGWDNRPVHESLLLSNYSAGRIPGVLLHHSHRDLDQRMRKHNRYSTIKAEMINATRRPVSLATAVAHGLAAFGRCLLLKGAILDGWRGIVYAMMAGHATLLAYAKAIESNMRAEQADRHDPSRDEPNL